MLLLTSNSKPRSSTKYPIALKRNVKEMAWANNIKISILLVRYTHHAHKIKVQNIIIFHVQSSSSMLWCTMHISEITHLYKYETAFSNLLSELVQI